MTDYEKHAFGATVVETPTSPHPATLQPPAAAQLTNKPSTESLTSPLTLQDSRDDFTPKHEYSSTNPFSPFYQHPASRSFLEQPSQNQSRTNIVYPTYTQDLESGLIRPSVSNDLPKKSVDGRVKECTVWPSQQTLKEKARSEKRRRGRMPWRNLNKRQMLYLKLAVILVLIGLVVGLGVGITKAVGGGVWSGRGEQHSIPDAKNP